MRKTGIGLKPLIALHLAVVLGVLVMMLSYAAVRLIRHGLTTEQWQAIGRCIKRFHQQGIYHADLNAHNILLRDAEVFLIDFDKGEQRPAGRWCQANLKRLLRSLTKLANQYPCFAFNSDDWQILVDAYEASPAR